LVNVDAALFTLSCQMGAGIVMRNHMGICVGACSNNIEEITIPELAKAHVVRLALSFAKDEVLSNIQLATDCLSVVQRITGKEKDRSL
jgi:hypothetical protein